MPGSGSRDCWTGRRTERKPASLVAGRRGQTRESAAMGRNEDGVVRHINNGPPLQCFEQEGDRFVI